MKNPILIILAFLFSLVAFSQKKSRGDRFFENGDYLNAIEEYAAQLNDGKYTKHIFENISTSYYNTYQFRKAYRALSRLTIGRFTDKDKTYDNEYNFKMYQVLSALGEYDKALPYLEKYRTNNGQESINTEVAIANIEAFKLKEDDFKVKNTRFLNSKRSEFGAVKVDDMVYFTSDRKPDNILNKNYRWTHRPFLNVFKVEVDTAYIPQGQIEALSTNVNSNLHEGNFCFTADGKTMYISRSNKEKGRKKFDSLRKNPIHLYKSVKTDSLWSKPEKLPFNNINYTVEHPALSPDGKKLFFASNMAGGYGGFDLYYVTVNDDGTYGKPVNLGETVNTPNREQFPFISKEGNLFFSSNGHLGLGMMDVFVAKANNDEFEAPINLGAPINSSYDDFSFNYYSVNKGFFASNRNKKSDEIYNFTQIGEVFIRPYNARFEVRDAESKEYVPNATISLVNENDEQIHNTKTDSIAAVNIDIMPGRYTFKADAEYYTAKEKPLWVKEKEGETYVIFLQKDKSIKPQEPKKEITAVDIKKEKEALKKQLLEDESWPPVTINEEGKMFFEMPPIYFDYDKWNIREDSKKILEQLALKLVKYQTVKIKISAHTDSRGTEAYNQLLSERRAESTRNYLALIGFVNARRIAYKGYGESQLLITCENKICTEEEHQTNRRSEFEIVEY